MVNLFLIILRTVYILAGVFVIYSSVFLADISSDLVRTISFILVLALGIMFIWFSYMLGKRRIFILRYIIIVHMILAVLVAVTFIGMFLDPDSYFHKDPFFYVIPLIFWTLVVSSPIYFLTRPKIKELFHL